MQIIDKASVKPARHKAGLTQQQLADKAGTSRKVISSLETGSASTDIDTFNRIVSAIRAEMEAGK